MKKLHSIVGALANFALAASAGFLVSCKHMDSEEHESAHVHKYTCAMHPEVVQDSPGTCPKCGMKLVHKDF
jgi:Cu(I)/Ag(I) efflux system membrane fusion protein